MPSFLVYEAATGRPLFVQQSKNPPSLPAAHAFLPVADGTVPNRGDTVADGILTPYVPTLTDGKAAKIVAAKAHLGTLIAAGFSWGGRLFQIDERSQARIAAAGSLAAASMADPERCPWDDKFGWITADNSRVAMNARAMQAFAQAVARYAGACALNLRTIKDSVTSAADQASLDAIDVTAGYPAASA